jgi:hypothetical protein
MKEKIIAKKAIEIMAKTATNIASKKRDVTFVAKVIIFVKCPETGLTYKVNTETGEIMV